MGEAARKKDLVEDIRKKIGDAAAEVVGDMRNEVSRLSLEHAALAKEIESFRTAVAEAKAAPAQLRLDVRSLAGAIQMQGERLDALAAAAAAPVSPELEFLLGRVDTLERQIPVHFVSYECRSIDLQRFALLNEVVMLVVGLTWWQRVVWMLFGRLPAMPDAAGEAWKTRAHGAPS